MVRPVFTGLLSLLVSASVVLRREWLPQFEDCVQNAFGAEFCGEEGKRYCAKFGGPACKDLGWPAPSSRFP